MSFEKEKKDVLGKKDKSKKQDIDKDIRPLFDLINSLPNYYTTSSCAGRILVLSIPKDYRKDKVGWLFASHDAVEFKNIKEALGGNKIKGKDIWFREESIILHVCCRTLDDANKMIDIARDIGFKRSGIISLKKIMLEIMSTEHIHVPVVLNGRLLIDDKYLKILVWEANKKLKRTKDKIKRFYSGLKDIISCLRT